MKQIIGRIRPVFQGEYDAAKGYAALDRVVSNGIMYECLIDAPAGTDVSDEVFWECLYSKGTKGEKGDKGPSGSNGTNGARGNKGAAGKKGAVPSHKWEGTTLFWNDEANGVSLQGPQGEQGGKGEQGGAISLSADPANEASQTIPASSYSMKVICDKANEGAGELSDSIDSQSSTSIASSKAVKTAVSGGGMFPGVICAFYGSFGGTDNRYPIPIGNTEPDTGWVLCDGVETNGFAVPDLRGRFIRCAAKTDAHFTNEGATGGASTHTHTISVNGTTLTTAQIYAHSHSVRRTHPGTIMGPSSGSNNTQLGKKTTTTGSTGSSSSHTHSLSSSGAASNEPPYMTIAYIIKLPN